MSDHPKTIVVSGAFDNLGATDLRLLEEAAKLGELTVLLWPDETGPQFTRQPYKFPLEERLYFLNAVRYVSRVIPVAGVTNPDDLPAVPDLQPAVWVDRESSANDARRACCQRRHLEYLVVATEALNTWPEPSPMPSTPGKKKVLVTGSYDWFHSGTPPIPLRSGF